MKPRAQVIHLDALPPGVVLYTKAQMAAAMQVSVRCLTELMRRKEISYLRIGRLVRFRPEDAVRRLTQTSGVNLGGEA